jgi:hypothetical protein
MFSQSSSHDSDNPAAFLPVWPQDTPFRTTVGFSIICVKCVFTQSYTAYIVLHDQHQLSQGADHAYVTM